MADSLAQQFINALSQLEQSRNADPIAALFAENADTGNIIAPEKFHGPDGAREFWTKYRDTFENVQSKFRNEFTQGNLTALEWITEGTTSNGAEFSYEGVSIIEADGGKISRFRAYFDSGSLGRQLETPETKVVQA